MLLVDVTVMAHRSKTASLLLSTLVGLGACGQISDTSADQVPVAPTGNLPSERLTQETSTDDQLQPLKDPPSTLAATDDPADTSPDSNPASSPDNSPDSAPTTGPDVDWVTFELTDIFDEGHQVTAAIPAGWIEHDVFVDRWRPPDNSGHGFFTDIGFDDGCDGVCQAKDWERALNGPDGQLSRARDEWVVLRDESIDNGWIMVTEGAVVSRKVTVLRWNNDADFFFQCRVELDEEDAHLVDEMVDICLLADPLWLD